MKLKRIIIAGEGGQGIQSLAHILVGAAYAQKLNTTFLPNFGVEQRGGVSLAYIQISGEDISFPKFEKADILVLFAERAVSRIEMYLKKETILLFDNSLIDEKSIEHLKVTKIALPASKYARERLVPRVFNILILGGLVGEIGTLKIKKVEQELLSFFSDKIKEHPELKHFNVQALRYGYNTVNELKKVQKWRQKNLKK